MMCPSFSLPGLLVISDGWSVAERAPAAGVSTPIESLPDPPDAYKDQVDNSQEKDAAPKPDDAADDGHCLTVRRPE